MGLELVIWGGVSMWVELACGVVSMWGGVSM